MKIKKFEQKYTKDIIDVWYRSTTKGQSFISEEFWQKHKATVQDVYLPQAETWLIVNEEDQCLGFISLLGNFIGGLFVSPEFQGRGIGMNLISHVNQLKGELSVDVYRKNMKAREFYKKCGFNDIKEEIQEETGEVLITMMQSMKNV
ncbi:hypothetical protein BHU72_08575 [Desulfuribacillus stibiiarsenatis]|uniref:N-acetyltransferase domain-containing protein n=2 Tax=Desulfuribacillus stibiiarsenatis TaxID=1390249 RepID=A0A1E5L3F4_9FIRM|nr:hypothetical protein BHU72_08575 [Desulfuribacillus stibiiarsenatis]